jgi:hypothetical protein
MRRLDFGERVIAQFAASVGSSGLRSRALSFAATSLLEGHFQDCAL